MLISVHRSNQVSFDASVESEIKHNYADIGIENYFNDKHVLEKIDPNIAEDARLDTVFADSKVFFMIDLVKYFFNFSILARINREIWLQC